MHYLYSRDPNKGANVRPEWPKYNWKQAPFLRFKPPSSEVGESLIADRVAAWKKLEALGGVSTQLKRSCDKQLLKMVVERNTVG